MRQLSAALISVMKERSLKKNIKWREGTLFIRLSEMIEQGLKIPANRNRDFGRVTGSEKHSKAAQGINNAE